MLGRRAAAAADEREPVLLDEGLLGVGQALGVEREVRPVLGEHRQSGVRHAEQRDAGVPGEVAQVFAHLGGAGRAVQADHVDAERFERGQRGTDLGSEQHGAGGLEGQRAQHQEVAAHRLQGAPRTQHGGLGLQEVLRGLDDERVGAAGDQPFGVLLESVAQDRVGGVAQRRQLGAGADGAEHPALPAGGFGEPVGDLAGDARAGLGELVDPAGDVVLTEGGGVGPEGVGLDAVHADGEVLLVHRADDVGPGHVQDLVAAFEVLEVVERGVLGLEHRAHGTVGHDHSGGESLSEGCGSGPAVSGRGRQRGHGCSPWNATAVGFAPFCRGGHAASVAGRGAGRSSRPTGRTACCARTGARSHGGAESSRHRTEVGIDR